MTPKTDLELLREAVERQEAELKAAVETLKRLAGDPEPDPGTRMTTYFDEKDGADTASVRGSAERERDRRRRRGEEGGSL